MIKIRKINRGDVYMVEIENSRDSEQFGKRPAVVIQNNVGNTHSPTTIIAFVTSKRKKKLPTHVQLHCRNLAKTSTVMLEQIRTVSANRIGSYIGTLGRRDMNSIDQALKISLGIDRRSQQWGE